MSDNFMMEIGRADHVERRSPVAGFDRTPAPRIACLINE